MEISSLASEYNLDESWQSFPPQIADGVWVGPRSRSRRAWWWLSTFSSQIYSGQSHQYDYPSSPWKENAGSVCLEPGLSEWCGTSYWPP